MRFSVAAAAVAAATGAAAYSNGTAPVYVTEVVTAFTTYCPEATSLTHNGVTYTVSEATTLTITDCPCTITKPATSSAVVASSSPAAPVEVSSSSSPAAAVSVSSSASTPAAPVIPTTAPVYSNGTASTTKGPVASGTGVTTGSSSSPVPFTGAASKATISGAGLAAIFGLAAFAL